MNERSLWSRLKRARVVQVLAVYLGASWVLLQIADVLAQALALPGWVMPVTVLLLLVGMVVIVFTAWIQALPSTHAGEQSGDLPTDWEIAPKDAVASIRRGSLPHLTWGRAVLGGVVALSLLFGGTGLYVGFNSGGSRIGPSPAGASEAAEGIAVVPFDVRGEGLDIWREGMMDLLVNGLDGVGGYRTIDARTVMARWQSSTEAGGAADLETAMRVAASTGARYLVEGSVVGLGNDVRLVANVYDLSSREKVAQGQAQGPATDVLRLADELAVGTMRDLLRTTGNAGAADLAAETLTTNSLSALQAFLEGESRFRKGRFAEAVQSYERAVAEDSVFAIALVRLSEAHGWLESQDSERTREYGERAAAQVGRLSPRYQFIMDGWSAFNEGTPDGVAALEEAVQKYPDDPEAWFLLAETYIHVGPATYGTSDELWEALTRAISLDPNFAPYRLHEAQYAILRGDRPRAEEAVEAYVRLSGDRDGLEDIAIALPLLLGDPDEVAGAITALDTVSERTVGLLEGEYGRRHDRWERELPIQDAIGRVLGVNRDAFKGYLLAGAGRVLDGSRMVEGLAPSTRAAYWAYAVDLWDVDLPGPDDPGGPVTPATCSDPTFDMTCHVLLSTVLAAKERWAEQARIVAALRASAAELAVEEPGLAETRRAGADLGEATAAWRRDGRTLEARQALQEHTSRTDLVGDRARIELARLEASEGRYAEALTQYRTGLPSWSRAASLYGTATMHEALGRPDEARPYWESLATLTENGDDLPRILEAREKVGR